MYTFWAEIDTSKLVDNFPINLHRLHPTIVHFIALKVKMRCGHFKKVYAFKNLLGIRDKMAFILTTALASSYGQWGENVSEVVLSFSSTKYLRFNMIFFQFFKTKKFIRKLNFFLNICLQSVTLTKKKDSWLFLFDLTHSCLRGPISKLSVKFWFCRVIFSKKGLWNQEHILI